MPITPTAIVRSAGLLAGIRDRPQPLPSWGRGRDAERRLTTDGQPTAGHPVVQRT
jgi:hypothetical protein